MTDCPENWSPAERRRWAVELVLLHLPTSVGADAVREAAVLERYLVGKAEPATGRGSEASGVKVEDIGLGHSGDGANSDHPACCSQNVLHESVSNGGVAFSDVSNNGHDESLIGCVATPMMAEGEASGNAASPKGDEKTPNGFVALAERVDVLQAAVCQLVAWHCGNEVALQDFSSRILALLKSNAASPDAPDQASAA